MSVANTHNTLDSLVSKTKTALEQWLDDPQSKALQEEFREANLELLAFSRSQKEAAH